MREPVAALGRLLAAGLVGALACASDEPVDSSAGSLRVEWTGADTGMLSAPAVAEWCDSLALLEIRAIHGDTGIALVLYPADSGADSVRPGSYSVVPPKRAARTRPASAVAMRWFAETSIRGFSGDSGTVVLEAAGAGRLSAHLHSPSEGGRLMLTGSFKGLTATPAPPDCAGAPPSASDEGQGADQDDEPDYFEDPDRNNDDPDQNDDDPD